jgi:hypothetical protein
MVKFGEIERVSFSEVDSVLPLPPTTPPFTSPFPLSLINGSTVNLALLNVSSRHDNDGVLLQAVINWSATFTPPANTSNVTITIPGYTTVSFEILLNGIVIARTTQTAVQNSTSPTSSSTFSAATTTFNIAALSHFDKNPIFNCHLIKAYALRVTNISVVAPQVSSGVATASASAGAVTMLAGKVAARRL